MGGSDEVVGKFFPSVTLVYMSFDVNVLHPTCPSLDKVNFALGKITSRFVTVMAEVGRTS